MSEHATRVDNKLKAVLPSMPAENSIVTDAQGWTWQRTGHKWRSCRPQRLVPILSDATPVQSRGWADLLITYGPVTVRYEAPEPTSESDGKGS